MPLKTELEEQEVDISFVVFSDETETDGEENDLDYEITIDETTVREVVSNNKNTKPEACSK